MEMRVLDELQHKVNADAETIWKLYVTLFSLCIPYAS